VGGEHESARETAAPVEEARAVAATSFATVAGALEMLGFPAGASNSSVARLLGSRDLPEAALQRQGKGSYAGGTWDTGPAKVVPLVPTASDVDGKKATLIEKAKAIKEIATNLKEIADKVQEFGEKGWDDDDVIAMAKTVNGLHGSVNKIADACTTLAGVESSLIASDAKAVEYLDKAIQAAETIQTLAKAKAAADAFKAKPDYETASAWADQIGDVFDKAGAYIPTGALPSFMGDYFKGLFSAPKNYIAAFKGMMEQRYKDVEAVTGVKFGGVEHNKGAYDLLEGKYTWEGEMSGIFIGAAMSGDPRVANGLQSYMRNHQKAVGVNLYKINDPKVGLGLLQAEIEADESLSPEDKAAYLAYLGSAGG
jgi:hypothetical protein